jgi:hypothetical protein
VTKQSFENASSFGGFPLSPAERRGEGENKWDVKDFRTSNFDKTSFHTSFANPIDPEFGRQTIDESKEVKK